MTTWHSAGTVPAMGARSPDTIARDRATLERVRAWMAEHHWTAQRIATCVGHHASTVRQILRGDWGGPGTYQWPRYFDVFLGDMGLHPDGWGEYVLAVNGVLDEEKTLRTSPPDAERRNARFASEGRPVRWTPRRPPRTDPDECRTSSEEAQTPAGGGRAISLPELGGRT